MLPDEPFNLGTRVWLGGIHGGRLKFNGQAMLENIVFGKNIRIWRFEQKTNDLTVKYKNWLEREAMDVLNTFDCPPL